MEASLPDPDPWQLQGTMSDLLARGHMLRGATGPPKSLQAAGHTLLCLSTPSRLSQSHVGQVHGVYGALTGESGCLSAAPRCPLLPTPLLCQPSAAL